MSHGDAVLPAQVSPRCGRSAARWPDRGGARHDVSGGSRRHRRRPAADLRAREGLVALRHLRIHGEPALQIVEGVQTRVGHGDHLLEPAAHVGEIECWPACDELLEIDQILGPGVQELVQA